MKQILSRTLNEVFQCDEYLQVNADTKTEKTLLILNHTFLMRVLRDKLASADVRTKCVCANSEHSVYECIIEFNQKRSYQIGEALTETLYSNIAKNYPTTTAYQRAIDRAVIEILDFEEKVFSGSEMQYKGLQRIIADTTKKSIQQNQETEQKGQGNQVTSSPNNSALNHTSATFHQANQTAVSTEKIDSLKNYVIQTNKKYAGKSIEEIDALETANKGNWFTWFLNTYRAKSADEKREQSVVHEYLMLKTVQ